MVVGLWVIFYILVNSRKGAKAQREDKALVLQLRRLGLFAQLKT